MEAPTTTPTQDKQVTVDVPEDRVAEFYAWYSRFLAGRGRSRRCGHHGHRGRHFGEHGRPTGADQPEQAPQAPPTTV
jgi:hypothetical protein